MDPVDGRTDGLESSLNLYRAPDIQLDYQQLITEAPLFLLLSKNTMAVPSRSADLTDNVGDRAENPAGLGLGETRISY